jgi:hypothetical protein
MEIVLGQLTYRSSSWPTLLQYGVPPWEAKLNHNYPNKKPPFPARLKFRAGQKEVLAVSNS